ncbi:MAG: DUF1207 domain-containing protein, partial [Planctomycetota bacterium]
LLPAAAGSGWRFGPADSIYPDYLADPRRSDLSAAQMWVPDSDFVDRFDTASSRFDLHLGERIPIARWEHPRAGAVEVAMEGAFFGQFDQDSSLDNLGWDGWYGGVLAWRPDPRWALKLHYRHLSSHLGDELIENTGRRRSDYTREDLTIGAALQTPGGWGTVYAEAGWALRLSSSSQEDGYAQAGWQLQDAEPAWGPYRRYAALDLQFFEEEDWEPATSLQVGLLRPAERVGEALRLAANIYHGRMQVGELREFDETTISLVLGWDF